MPITINNYICLSCSNKTYYLVTFAFIKGAFHLMFDDINLPCWQKNCTVVTKKKKKFPHGRHNSFQKKKRDHQQFKCHSHNKTLNNNLRKKNGTHLKRLNFVISYTTGVVWNLFAVPFSNMKMFLWETMMAGFSKVYIMYLLSTSYSLFDVWNPKYSLKDRGRCCNTIVFSSCGLGSVY